MNLIIKEINDNNLEEMLNLRISKEQSGFIETIEDCLKEASENSIWRPVGIYNEDVAIGFAMYGLFIDEGKNGRVWLDRFLISELHQGKGYGKASVKALINRLYKEYGYKKIYLSVYDDNKVAIALYEKVGFNFNGEVDSKGEKIMTIDLENNSVENF